MHWLTFTSACINVSWQFHFRKEDIGITVFSGANNLFTWLYAIISIAISAEFMCMLCTCKCDIVFTLDNYTCDHSTYLFLIFLCIHKNQTSDQMLYTCLHQDFYIYIHEQSLNVSALKCTFWAFVIMWYIEWYHLAYDRLPPQIPHSCFNFLYPYQGDKIISLFG